jgi:hypothetical protein
MIAPRKEDPSPLETTPLPLLAVVMEIQRTLGSLTQAVETLNDSQKTTQSELTYVVGKVRKAGTDRTIVWVVGLGIIEIIGFVGWLINSAIAILPSLLHPDGV